MNERIKELAEQSLCIKGGEFSFNGGEVELVDLKKFAELIVRECLVQVNEVYTSLDNKDKRVGAAAVGLTIAAHFGVEL